MELDPAAREPAYLDITSEYDLGTATLMVSVEGAAFSEWSWFTSASGPTGGLYRRTAVKMLCGPDHPDPAGALVVQRGRNSVRWYPTGPAGDRPIRPGETIVVEDR